MSFNNSMILSHLNGWSASSIIPGGMIPDSFLFYWQCSICDGIQCHQWRCLTLSIKYFPSQLVHACPTLLYRYPFGWFYWNKDAPISSNVRDTNSLGGCSATSTCALLDRNILPTRITNTPLASSRQRRKSRKDCPPRVVFIHDSLTVTIGLAPRFVVFPMCPLAVPTAIGSILAGITFHHRTNVILRLEAVSTIDCSGIHWWISVLLIA